MKKYNAEFYSAMLKQTFKKDSKMQEKNYRKSISEISDGEHTGVLKRIFKNALKNKEAFFLNLLIDVDGEEYSYGHYCSDRSIKYLFSDILMPLGLYASEQGISDSLDLRDIFIKFEKTTSNQYTSLKILPVYEYKEEAPVGSKNRSIEHNKNNDYVKEEDTDMDEIPY